MAISCWRCCSFFFPDCIRLDGRRQKYMKYQEPKKYTQYVQKASLRFWVYRKKIRHCSCKEHRKYYIKAVKCYSLSSSLFLSLCVCLTFEPPSHPTEKTRINGSLTHFWYIWFVLCFYTKRTFKPPVNRYMYILRMPQLWELLICFSFSFSFIS